MEHSRTTVNLRDVSKSFDDSSGRPKSVLQRLTFEVREPEFVAIVGPNGCGKTSVLNLIGGSIEPDSGSVEIRTGNQRNARIGYVWQNYRASLLPWLNVRDNVTFPLRIKGRKRNERTTVGDSLLEQFLPHVDPDSKCYALSGGEQQLVSILRCMAIEPDLLLMDEPFSALDQARSWKMAIHVEDIWNSRRMPVIFVSHDIDEAVLLADRIVLMSSDGTIAEEIYNPSSRPRGLEMLTSQDHVKCRNRLVSFLREQEASK